jgi:hypothetical protein
VTLWSWLTFGFMAPLFRLANTKTLDDADIWDLSLVSLDLVMHNPSINLVSDSAHISNMRICLGNTWPCTSMFKLLYYFIL